MKIVFITLAYPPTHVGGTELSTHALAHGLQRAGHEVQVICGDGWYKGPRHWNGVSQKVYEGVPVTRLHINWALAPDPCRYQYDNPLVDAYLHDYLSSTRPDVVHVTSCLNVSAAAITAPTSLGFPLVLTVTDFWFICPLIKLITKSGDRCDGHVTAWECLKCTLWGTKVYRWSSWMLPESTVATMLRWVAQRPSLCRQSSLIGQAFDIDHRRAFLKQALQQCDQIIVKSNYMYDVFAQHGVSHNKLVVLPDGEDTSWGPVKARNGTKGLVRIGYIGHIIPPKGIHLLVQAVRQLRGPAELLIFGDMDHNPAYADTLRALAGQNGRINFQGGFPHHQIGEVLSQVDVLVVPSVWPETFGHVVREGFIARIPVIGANIGAIPEAIEHGQNGFLFSPGDVEDLRRHLQMIVEDPGILEQLREGIPEVKTIGRQIDELTNLYQTLLFR